MTLAELKYESLSWKKLTKCLLFDPLEYILMRKQLETTER